jgi:Flp pilus assembly secretin CpaC
MTQRSPILFAVAIAALACSACNRDDTTINAEVQSRVNQSLPRTANVEVAVSDGVVTLSGLVPTAAAKQRAEDVAKKVDGVKGVRDEIQLDPGPEAPPVSPPAPRR